MTKDTAVRATPSRISGLSMSSCAKTLSLIEKKYKEGDNDWKVIVRDFYDQCRTSMKEKARSHEDYSDEIKMTKKLADLLLKLKRRR